DGEVVVGVHQPGAPGDDAVPVIVRVVAKGNVELVFQVDQARHRVWRRTDHADLPVVIHRHEGEGRIDPAVDDGQVQAVHVGNRLPVGDARSTHRVHADVQPCPGDGLHVHHRAEVAHIGQHVVIFV